MSESFAQLFEESLKGLETRQGSIVSGTVVAIQKGFVLVDAGLKSEFLLLNSKTLKVNLKLKLATQ